MTQSNLTSIKLLFVEDDEDDYILTNELLHKSEAFLFDIEWIADPEKARVVLAKSCHDICLMDYRLGTEVGINLVRDAIELGFSSPIIMLTGQDDTDVEQEAARAGAVDYLVKENLSLEHLQRSIRYALARSEIQAERFERLRAESANRSKSEFLATLSHEIRTPLTSILGYTELLMDQYGSTDTVLLEKLGVIDRNGKHLLSLLNDTLDLSKIEAGKFEIEISEVELGPFLADIITISKAAAEENGLNFNFRCPGRIPGKLRTDATRLRQILLNLLGNAVKFTRQGNIDLLVEMKETGQNNQIIFQISDTGTGIDQSEIDRIFEPFTQLNTDADMQRGTGLGLTITRHLTSKLDASITVDSSPGKGSTFELALPVSTASHSISLAEISLTDTHPMATRQLQLKGKVLIVDDVQDVRNLIGNILTRSGTDIVYASNGKEAVDWMLKAGNADDTALILMDLNMPLLDGYEAIRLLRENNIAHPVIALTAASLQGEKEKCLEMGFSAYMSKPVTASSLITTIETLLYPELHTDISKKYDQHLRIMVVEDNQDAGHAVCQLLEYLGQDAISAVNANEALHCCQTMQPDLVLTDINLGRTNGFELAEDIHRLYPACRIYLVSGDPSISKADLPEYIHGFITKPVSLPSLQAIIAADNQLQGSRWQ